jgi:hypothetical protein
MMTRTAAWAAFEARAAAGASSTAIGSTATAGTMVAATIVAAAIIAIASATAIGPLEASARIATDARGIAREILARFGSAGTRCARFSGKQDAVVFHSERLRRRFGSGSLDRFVCRFFVEFEVAESCGVQCTFVRGICFRFA